MKQFISIKKEEFNEEKMFTMIDKTEDDIYRLHVDTAFENLGKKLKTIFRGTGLIPEKGDKFKTVLEGSAFGGDFSEFEIRIYDMEIGDVFLRQDDEGKYYFIVKVKFIEFDYLKKN